MSLFFQNLLRFVLLLAIQLLIIDNVTLLSVIVPFIFVAFLIMLPSNIGRIPMLLIGFGTGLVVDICYNLVGFHCFAATATVFARILFADRILGADSENKQVIRCPSIYSSSTTTFSKYCITMLAVYYIVYAIIESFSFHNFWKTLLCIILSIATTYGLILLYQLLFIRVKKE